MPGIHFTAEAIEQDTTAVAALLTEAKELYDLGKFTTLEQAVFFDKMLVAVAAPPPAPAPAPEPPP